MRLYLKLFVLFGLTSMPMAQEYDTTPTDSAISFSPTAAAPEFAPAFEPLAETSSDSLTTDTETNTAQSPAESVPPSQEKPALEISSDNPAVHFRIQEQVIQDSLDLVIRDQGKVRSEVETGMTPLRPKDEFETTASFETRKSAWEKDRDAKAATQLAPLMQKEKALRESLAKVHKDAAAQQGFLRIESEPQGAKVFVDGVESGKTPATVEHLWAGRRKVVLQLDGFQEFIATPDVQGSETTKLKAKLEEKSIFSEPHEVNLSALLAQDTPSVVVYQTRIAALLARISEVNEEAAAMLSDLKLKRPLQPKGEFETQAEFDKRQKEWLKAGQTEYAKIQQKQGEYVTRLQRAIEVLQDYILVQAGSPKAHLVPGNQMMLGAYNADAEQYPFTAENQEADYAFHWEGAMNIPVADAKAMNRQTEDCQLRAMYYDIPVLHEGLVVYPAWSGMEVVRAGKTYTTQGAFHLKESWANDPSIAAAVARVDSLQKGLLRARGLTADYALSGNSAGKSGGGIHWGRVALYVMRTALIAGGTVAFAYAYQQNQDANDLNDEYDPQNYDEAVAQLDAIHDKDHNRNKGLIVGSACMAMAAISFAF